MWVNTQLYCTEAEAFRRSANRKEYIPYPEGTYAANEYWDEQTKRCLEGYSVGGVHIPGAYYFYLNFFQILLKQEGSKRKGKDFPRFTDVDAEYFNIIERARGEGKGVILVKPRRRGFSFKAAALCAHEYTFFRDAKVVISAFDKKYSTNTMNMTLDGLNFLNRHTDWSKQRNPDTMDYVKARYKAVIDGKEIWKGSNSEIRSITFGDNPYASAGLTSSIFIMDETGIFPNIIDSYNISEYCWKDGSEMIGIPILFGSSGSMEKGSQYFEEMFYNPDKYNLLAFDNIWDEGKQGSKCGWFPKASRMRFGVYRDISGKYPEHDGKLMLDKDGNSIEFLAEQSVLDFRASKKKGTDEKSYRDAVTQEPLSPSEAFLRTKNVIFPDIDLRERLVSIERDDKFLDSSYKAELVILENGSIEARPLLGRNPIRNFPLKPEDLPTIQGVIEIWEKPVKDESGDIPYDRYLAGNDPIDDDGNSNVENSLQSTFIFDLYKDRIVAEYTGRTRDVKTYYENVRRLAFYYNAKVNYENNKKGLFGHFHTMNSVYRLCDVPKHLKDAEMIKSDTSSYNKSKGTPMNSTGMIVYGERLLNSYLLAQASDKEEGVNNCYTIPSVALLKELLAYDRETNTDRVSAMFMVMIEREQRLKYFRNKSIQANVPSFVDDDFFKRRRGNIDKTRAKVEELLFGDKMSFSDSDFFNQ